MKKIVTKLMTLLAASLLFAGSALATDYDFSGQLPYHNTVLSFSFTANGTSTVTLFSSSWDDGGFDPMLGLWTSGGDRIQFQDDGHNTGSTYSNGVSYTHGNWDSYYTEILQAGSYIVTLSTFPNWNLGNTLSAGFTYDGQVGIPVPQWNEPSNGYRTANYAFHILGVDTANQNNPVPEPSTLLLLGAGLLGLGFARKRFVKH